MLSRPPRVQWQHSLISRRFLPSVLLQFPRGQEQLSAGGRGEQWGAEHWGCLAQAAVCLFAGRTNASGQPALLGISKPHAI